MHCGISLSETFLFVLTHIALVSFAPLCTDTQIQLRRVTILCRLLCCLQSLSNLHPKFVAHHTCEALNPKNLDPKPMGNTWCFAPSVCHPSPCKQAPVWEATSKGFVHLIFDELDDYTVQVINLKQENSVHFKNETNWMNEIRSLGWLFHNYLLYTTPS